MNISRTTLYLSTLGLLACGGEIPETLGASQALVFSTPDPTCEDVDCLRWVTATAFDDGAVVNIDIQLDVAFQAPVSGNASWAGGSTDFVIVETANILAPTGIVEVHLAIPSHASPIAVAVTGGS